MRKPYVIGIVLLGLGIAVTGPYLAAQDDVLRPGLLGPRPGRAARTDMPNTAYTASANPATGYDFVSIDYAVAPWTVFVGINNLGHIAGWYNFTPATSPVGDTPVMFDGKRFHGIDIPGSTGARAAGINIKDVVVGTYTDAGGVDHGFVFSGGKISQIDFPGAQGSGTDLTRNNDAGDMVGAYEGAAGTIHAFLLHKGVFTSFDFPGAQGFTSALGINNAGDIVGEYFEGGRYHGYLYSGGVFTAINFPQATLTSAAEINDSGQIVGWYRDANGVEHGFVMSGGGNFVSVDPPGSVDTFLQGINNKGQTVGAAEDTQGELHSLLATPTP